MKKKILMPIWFAISIITVSVIYRTVLISTAISSLPESYSAPIQEVVYSSIKSTLVVIGIVVIGLYIVLNHIIKEVVEPVQLLTRQAKEASRGIYKHSVRHYEVEEIQQLANAFDYMGERVHRTIRKLNYQRSKAETVLSHLEQGIIVLDQDGFVTEINEVGKRLLNIDYNRRENLHIADVTRDSKWQQFTLSLIKNKKVEPTQMSKGELLMYISGQEIKRETKTFGFIISIKDITNIKKLEDLRYQFVSNVTHELKTPLTSIQGFVETLQCGALENPEMAKRFIDIIDVEAKRLNQLIQDILALSEIENSTRAATETVEVHEVVQEVVKSVQILADKKGIELICDIQQQYTLKNAEREQVKQIVVNLLTNAIRYTDEGSVGIVMKMEEERLVLTVKDTGIGIPKENIERIFERFYRVDKSRSRQRGGTGLGLSIVKHIIKLYDGEISVTSEVGEGSTFTVRL